MLFDLCHLKIAVLEISKAKLTLSSDKLIREGFNFKYGIEEIYDQTVEYFKAKGLLQI